MSTPQRIAATFGLPLALLAVMGTAGWLIGARNDRQFGPMLRVPFTPRAALGTSGTDEPPLNTPEKLSPLEAELRNSLINFSQAPLQSPARYVVGTGGEEATAALQCLTSAIYYEAGQETAAGRRAVAQVILNRWASAPFPKTVCGVVGQGAPRPGCQFTFMCDGSTSHPPDPRGWAAARDIAQSVVEGATYPGVGSATHYHADYVVPVWAMTMLKLVKIGRHIFYRWPGARLAQPSTMLVAAPEVPEPSAPLFPSTAATLEPPRASTPVPEPDPVATPVPPAVTPTAVAAPTPAAAPAPRAPSAPPRRALPERSLRGNGPF